MRNWLRYATMAALAFATQPSVAASGIALEWSDLPDPSAQVFDDPFRDLSAEQMVDLQFAVRLRVRLQQNAGSAEERAKWQELLNETEAALAQDQIDVEWMLNQREAVIQRRTVAGTAGNPLHDGQTITLDGYAIPAPPDADGHPVAYLVPEPGMCSHRPPPPPNQMIRVLLNDDWAPTYYHEPVRLTGMLSIAPTEEQMVVVDGLMPMRATFLLKVDQVYPLASPEENLEWNQTLMDRIRAADHRKTGGLGSVD